MKMYDFVNIRLSTRMLCALVGQRLSKCVSFGHDPYSLFYEEAFLYVDHSVYALSCEDDLVTNDTASFVLEEVRECMVHSHTSPPHPRWETLIDEPIEQITRVDECHRIDDRLLYMTRGLIFHTVSRDVCFSKDTPQWSEKVAVDIGERGHLDVAPLIKTYNGDYDFDDAEAWSKDTELTVVRENVVIGDVLEEIATSEVRLLERVEARDKIVRALCFGTPDEIRAVGTCPWCGEPIVHSFTAIPFGRGRPSLPSHKLNVSCACGSSERFFNEGDRPNCVCD